MTLRWIDPAMNPGVVQAIDARLVDIEIRHRVQIALAIESGSRAWGFPSPDSDYDCRFVFIRQPQDYLALFPERDVIETPLTPVFDVNGWDLAKAIKLLLKGNAVVIEWLTSPVIYRGDAGLRARFAALAAAVADRGMIAHHYFHLTEAQRTGLKLERGSDVPLKKLLYALRPAMALRWLRTHTSGNVAPMNLLGLMKDIDLPLALRTEVTDLLSPKAETRELGTGPTPEQIGAFIMDELAVFRAAPPTKTLPTPEQVALAQAFFLQEIGADPVPATA